MRSRRVLAAVLVLGVLLAGLTALVHDETPSSVPEHETFVFDHSGGPVVEGGIAYESAAGAELYHVTLVTSREEMDRFNDSLFAESGGLRRYLSEDVRPFLNGTDFDEASLVVVEAYPRSSSPDYRVERVVREGDTVTLRINDSSRGGTDDITVETLLVRVSHDGRGPPARAVVGTEDGFVLDSEDGVVRRD